MRRPDAREASLTRARLAALAFSLVAVGSTIVQMDRDLPAWRLVLAFLAVGLLLVDSVTTFLRGRTTWAAVLAGGPLVVAAAQGLRIDPAAVAVALGAIAGQLMFSSPRQTLWRVAGVTAAVPVLVGLAPLLDGHAEDPTMAVIPIPVLLMFSGMLRAVYSAIRGQLEASLREALMARTSRQLLGVVDLDVAQAVVRSAVDELCGLTPDLGAVLLDRRAGRYRVISAPGLAGPPVGTEIMDDELAARAGDGVLQELPAPVLAGTAVLAAAFRNRTVSAVRWGTAGDQLLLVGGRRPLPGEVRDILLTLGAQLSLIEAGCHWHSELVRLAHHDALTSISNRAAFFERLTEVVRDSVGQEARVGLLLVDLDDFKVINDTLGHAAGDHVLIEVAARMTEVTANRGVAARFGGDEFAVLLDVDEPRDAEQAAERLRDSIMAPIASSYGPLSVGASIGVVTGRPGATARDLLQGADVAMYSAKAAGKNRVARFSEELLRAGEPRNELIAGTGGR